MAMAASTLVTSLSRNSGTHDKQHGCQTESKASDMKTHLADLPDPKSSQHDSNGGNRQVTPPPTGSYRLIDRQNRENPYNRQNLPAAPSHAVLEARDSSTQQNSNATRIAGTAPISYAKPPRTTPAT